MCLACITRVLQIIDERGNQQHSMDFGGQITAMLVVDKLVVAAVICPTDGLACNVGEVRLQSVDGSVPPLQFHVGS